MLPRVLLAVSEKGKILNWPCLGLHSLRRILNLPFYLTIRTLHLAFSYQTLHPIDDFDVSAY